MHAYINFNDTLKVEHLNFKALCLCYMLYANLYMASRPG